MGQERRIIPRYRTNRPAQITLDDKSRIDCKVFDLSTGGAGLDGLNPARLPEKFILTIDRLGVRHRCRIAWRSKTRVGVEFLS